MEPFLGEYNYDENSKTLSVRLEGAMVMASMDDFRIEFKEAFDKLPYDCEKIVLDMSGVNYVDSSGMGSLVYVKRISETKDFDLFIKSPSDAVLSVLNTTRLSGTFHLI